MGSERVNVETVVAGVAFFVTVIEHNEYGTVFTL
jgi:hypothetical protein